MTDEIAFFNSSVMPDELDFNKSSVLADASNIIISPHDILLQLNNKTLDYIKLILSIIEKYAIKQMLNQQKYPKVIS